MSRSGRRHLKILVAALAAALIGGLAGAFVWEPLGLLAVVGLIVMAYYWWGGFIDLADSDGDPGS